ncbi:MAG: hypothetical protein M5U12_13065 [Verrucomicrobia bacterium]|nr:hypothetical protein [Verrucomicrobiota bacterium]
MRYNLLRGFAEAAYGVSAMDDGNYAAWSFAERWSSGLISGGSTMLTVMAPLSMAAKTAPTAEQLANLARFEKKLPRERHANEGLRPPQWWQSIPSRLCVEKHPRFVCSV